jgi:hypothetical protein
MSLGLDDRARRAADNLKASVEQAPLLLASRTLNGSGRRRVAAVLRPVWIASVLILGSAVGFALVVEPTVIESTTSTTAIAEVTTTATTVPATMTTTKQELAPFDANATFGSCSEEPPFDIYYGVGEPGSMISVQSEFGSGTTTVNGEGHWEIQVFFPEAPPDEGFLVKVIDEFGRKETFEFVFLPGI